MPTPRHLEAARSLHQTSLILDCHVDTMSCMLDGGYSLADAPDSAHLSWDRITAGGLKGQLFACWVDPDLPPNAYAQRVDAIIDRFEKEAADNPERFAACTTAGEIEAAFSQGRFAGVLAIEGGHAIEDSLDNLKHFYGRGVRAMTLTWNNTNNWADGCGPMKPGLPVHGGLTPFGEQVVGTMESLGMAVDISHVAPATYAQVLRVAEKPPFASHSSVKAINPHRRNLTDDQLRALADRGGVLGVCFCSGFLMDEGVHWAKAKQLPEYQDIQAKTDAVDFAGISEEEDRLYERTVPLADLDLAVRHVDHALKVMGTDHVSLGSDFDGARRFPTGLSHVGELPHLTAGLLELGWKPQELEGLLGRNLLEYLRTVL